MQTEEKKGGRPGNEGCRNMNCIEIPCPSGVIVSVIGDNTATANVTVSNEAAISPDRQP